MDLERGCLSESASIQTQPVVQTSTTDGSCVSTCVIDDLVFPECEMTESAGAARSICQGEKNRVFGEI